MKCADQPVTRDITKIGVYSGTSNPSAWYSRPAGQSRLGNRFFSYASTFSTMAAASSHFVSPAAWAASCACFFRMPARTSPAL